MYQEYFWFIRYDRKIEQEAANYNPWGKGGAGAPIRDSGGRLVGKLVIELEPIKAVTRRDGISQTFYIFPSFYIFLFITKVHKTLFFGMASFVSKGL